MIIIVGLGNPGVKFKNTRHNVGFMAVNQLAKENNFPEFKLDKKSNALTSGNNNILLVKPQTFMNESGFALKKIIAYYQLQTTNLVVVHDDIDLPIGKIKIVKDRGSAGHKGVESIIKAIGNKNLVRIRIGIKIIHTHASMRGCTKAKNIVLKKFSKAEQGLVDQAIQKACDAIKTLVADGLEKAMNQYN